jgi:dTDP-4-dehydrorhamnose reductase
MSVGRVLVTGGSGRLGRELLRRRPCVAPTHAECDVTDPWEVRRWVETSRPDVIVHAAAVVGAKECERDAARAWLVNVHGTANVARSAAHVGARLIHVSTAALFDGARGNYAEDDAPSPTYLYAWTKLAAESIALATRGALVVRVDFFAEDVAFKHRCVFVDHFTTKEPVARVAEKLLLLCDLGATGLFHVGGRRRSLYDILKPYFPEVEPSTIAGSALPHFPRDISLDTSKYDRFVEAARRGSAPPP